MKCTSFVVMMAAVLVVILAAGCTSAPVKETSNSSISATEPQGTVKYVELIMVDGTKVGGKYVSESAAFVTITPMYTLDENGFMKRGSGNDVGIKNSFISSMVTIKDPSSLVNATLKAQSDKADAFAATEKIEQDKKAAAYQIERAREEAEIAKRMPTKKSQH